MKDNLRNGCLLVALFACAVLILANSLTYPINHDEQQYVAAAYMAIDKTLYKDFIYLQTPYFPLVVSYLYQILDTQQYFLTARVINFGFSFLTVLMTALIVLRAARSKSLAAVAAVLLTSSSVMLFSFGVARNDMLPCMFQMTGLLFYLESYRSKRYHRFFLVVAGALAAMAVGSKISYVFFPAGLLIYLLRVDWRAKTFSTLWLALGGLLGSVPMLYYAVIAPEGFLYGNLGYHSTAPFEWYASRGLEGRLTFMDQMVQIRRFFLSSPVTWATVTVIALIAAWHLAKGKMGNFVGRLKLEGHAVLPLLCLLAIPMCILPKPTWIQYFVLIVPLMIVLAAVMVRASQPDARPVFHFLYAVLALVAAVPGAWKMGHNLSGLVDKTAWADKEITKIVDQLVSIQQETGKTLKVATLSPMHVLDANVDTYPELASGPFYYRTSYLQTEAFTAAIKGVSKSGLASFLDSSPPDVILIGYEQDTRINLDDDFRRYALARGYQEQPVSGTDATLFLRLTTQ